VTTQEALDRAMEALREIVRSHSSHALPVAREALNEIQRGLWIETVTCNYESETACLDDEIPGPYPEFRVLR
jgi:hypothetical protein